MGKDNSNNSNIKWAAITATALNGLLAGSLAFVSAVDVRTLLKHVEDENDDVAISVARRHFQVWWPYGRDWMVPLLVSASIANAVAWYMTDKDNRWAAAGICSFLLGPYTGIVLGEDIQALRKSSSGGAVQATTKRFCLLHHVRLGIVGIGFGLSLFGLTELKKEGG